jgi:hypothetical protein
MIRASTLTQTPLAPVTLESVTIGPVKHVALEIGMLLLVGLVALFAVYQVKPPESVPANAPASEFSSGRAMTHVKAVSTQPHPMGTIAESQARDYILQQLSALGVQPEVQETTVIARDVSAPFRAGNVHNIITQLKGSENGKALMLVAHYDSVPTSLGASDDGAGVAALLETLRALKTGAPLKNDLIFLFTDGEEVGLLGAQAFVNESPLAKNVGMVLNFEARGNSGPAFMFETSQQNGWLIKELAQAAPHPQASSLMSELYRMLSNDTDLTVFKKAGMSGLNFAYINGSHHYHALLDNSEQIDERSLQHQGDYALALSRHFGNVSLQNTKAGNDVYFDFLGLSLVAYPVQWVLFLAVALLLLFVAVIVMGFRSGALKVSGLGLGLLAFILSIVASVLVSGVVWLIISSLQKGYRQIPQGDLYNSGTYRAAFICLTIAITASIYILLRKRASRESLLVGGLVGWLVLTLLITVALPGASYLFTWPLFILLSGLLFSFRKKNVEATPRSRFVIVMLCALPAVLLLAPTIYVMLMALPIGAAPVVMILLVLQLVVVLPLLGAVTARRRWMLPGIALLLAFVFIALGSFTAGFNQDHPKQADIFYALDTDSSKAVWASADEGIDDWMSQFLSTTAKRAALPEFLPLTTRTFMQAQAPTAQLPGPEVKLLEDKTSEGTRTLRLHLGSLRQASVISIYTNPETEIGAASINGKRIETDSSTVANKGQKQWGLRYFAPPSGGLDLTLEVRSAQPLKIRVVDQTYGLPQTLSSTYQPRPANTIPTAYPYNPCSDSTLVSKSYIF